jgi:hypothetical protein
LTEKEKRRAERHEKRLMEERSYQKKPETPQPYTGAFMIPDRNMPILKFLGEKEMFLNSLRAECKCFMWYDNGANVRQNSTGRNRLHFLTIMFLFL